MLHFLRSQILMIALALLTTGTTWAEDFPKDSLKVVDIEEVVVIRHSERKPETT